MFLNDMDISRLMVHAHQIKEYKIREIRQEGKSPRSDDSSHQKHKKRFCHQYYSMRNKDGSPNQHSQGSGHTFERTRCHCGKQHLGRFVSGTDGCFSCGRKGQKMRDFPNIKARGKEVNKASLDPNAPKKNPFDN